MKSEAGNRTYGMFGGSSVDRANPDTESSTFKRNCYLASELAPFRRDDDRFHGGYPHCGEATTPTKRASLRSRRWPSAGRCTTRSEDECRKILSEERRSTVRFDLDALASIAAEIGPTVAEVHTPLGDTGYRAPAAFGYRPFEGGLALKRLAPQRL